MSVSDADIQEAILCTGELYQGGVQ